MRIQCSLILLMLADPVLSQAQTQSALMKNFAELKSPDQEVSSTARRQYALLLEQELPTIEKDSAFLCSSLEDPSPLIRSAAAGVYATIVMAAPEHSQVVSSCTSGLVKAAADKEGTIQQNSLLALSLNKAGQPSPLAQPVFRAALTADNPISVQAATTGLLRENGTDSQHNIANIGAVADSLQNTGNSESREAILHGITASGAKSDVLFQAAERMLGDSDADVKEAALYAVAGSATDPARAVTVMQGVVDSATATPHLKQSAQAQISELHPN
jgi:hypothetical protein